LQRHIFVEIFYQKIWL